METDYDDIADTYSKHWEQKVTENLGYNELVENLIRSPKGKHILDYWCGSGDIAKILSEKWAIVKGVDISRAMVNIAKQKAPLAHIELITRPKGSFHNIQKELYDVVTMNYVLCVLQDQKEIKSVLRGAHRSLKKEGKLFIQNANRDKANGIDFASYWLLPREDLKDGDKVHVRLNLDTPLFIEDYFFSQETHKRRLTRIGFSDIVVHELLGSPEDGRPKAECTTSPCYIIEARK